MNRIIFILIIFWLAGCKSDTDLFNDISKMAGFETAYSPNLIKSGKEDGFLEPIMEYGLFKIDTQVFSHLENSILTSKKFNQGKYYLNLELDNYLQQNKLEILNMSKSLISENHYDKTYHVYLLSDRKTFAICTVNH